LDLVQNLDQLIWNWLSLYPWVSKQEKKIFLHPKVSLAVLGNACKRRSPCWVFSLGGLV
jgi:hypothetical protein